MSNNFSAEPKSTLKNIKLSDIRENPVALRSVDRKNPEYIQLVDSVKAHGVFESILVREMKDPETNAVYYGLINGLQRYTASQDAGRETIPAKVVALSDAEVLEAQVITNVHRVETKPVEYSKQLIRILSGNPTLTISNLASKLSKSPSWVSERLGLVKLDESIAKLVDDSKINLSNAYALAKLPIEEQAAFVDRAITQTPQEFVPAVNTRVKELRDATRQGRNATAMEFTPVPFQQKLSTIKAEFENPTIGPILIESLKVKTPAEAFKLAISWVLHMDELSIEQSKKEDAERKQKEAEAKEARKSEAQSRRAKAAAEAQAGVKEAIGV